MDRTDEVRDLYERMPYPTPRTSLDAHRDLYNNQDRRRAEFHGRPSKRKYNLENLELHQLPIERVREIGRSFDLVVRTRIEVI